MALQTIKGFLSVPDHYQFGASLPNYSGKVIDADGEKVAFIFKIPSSADGKNISKIGFKTGAVPSFNGSSSLKVSIFTVDTNGDPTTTAYKGMVAGTQASVTANTWFTVALGTAASSIVKEDTVGIVIEYNVFTASDSVEIEHMTTSYEVNHPYVSHFTAGWIPDDVLPVVSLEYSDGSYETIPGLLPFSAITNNVNFNNTSDPDHRGLIFKLPFPARIMGCWVIGDFDGDFNLKLYDSDGTTVLNSMGFDKDLRANSSHRLNYLNFTSATLNKDVFYRLALEPSTSTGIDLDEFDVDAAAIMDSFGGGQDFHYTQKKDAGWTDTVTKRPMMGIFLDQFDDGVGGGGGGLIVHPGMSGGMRG